MYNISKLIRTEYARFGVQLKQTDKEIENFIENLGAFARDFSPIDDTQFQEILNDYAKLLPSLDTEDL